MRLHGWLAPIASLMLVACGDGPAELGVERAIVRLSPDPAAPSVAYFTVKGGPTDDRLIAVTPVVIRTEIHESMTMDGMAIMKPIAGGVPVPANSTIQFEQGGKHVMLFDVNKG